MTPTTQQSKFQTADDEVDLGALLGILLDYKSLIIGITVVFAVIGIIWAKVATPVYQADAVIQIESKKGGMPGLEDLAELTGKDPEAVTEIELLKSRWVIGRAVDSLHLDIVAKPIRMPLIGDFMARRFSPGHEGEVANSLLPLTDKYDWGGAKIEVSQLDLSDDLLGQALTLVAGKNGSYLLKDDEDTALLEGYVGQLASAKGISLLVGNLVANPGQQFYVARIPRLTTLENLRDSLRVVERGRNTGIIGLSFNDRNPKFAVKVLDEVAHQYVQQNVDRMSEEAARSVAFLREQLPQIREEMERATAALNQYQVDSKSVDITIETQGVLQQLVQVEAAISDLKLKQLELDKRFTQEHPVYQTLLKQLLEMEAKKSDLEGKVANLPETQQAMLKLTRDMQVSTELYTLLMNKAQELDIIRAGTVGNVRIIDNAEVDISSPVKPKKALIVILATVLGGILGIVITGIHVALTRGIEDPNDIEALGLPVNATIPYSSLQAEAEKAQGEKGKFMPMLALSHPSDPAIEAIRSLRTSLHFSMMDASNNILAISGPSPQVGKTFVSANMAVTMAQAGKKVLLIDADMRKGYMQRFFSLESDQVGLSSILSKQGSLEDALVHTEVPGLDFIARGPVPKNPSELLLSPLFETMLKNMASNYDLVIVDTPPILAVADALIVSKLAGASFIVARFSKNPLGEIQATISRFENNGIKLDGAILNATHKRSLAYYGYQKYGYGNYEYQYYGQEEKKSHSRKKNS
jgi:tyrosine-protein kinase Etk/Wzc